MCIYDYITGGAGGMPGMGGMGGMGGGGKFKVHSS